VAAMASFGRRPPRGGVSAGSRPGGVTSSATGKGSASDTFKKLQQEEAERARFAKEYEEREQREREHKLQEDQEAKSEQLEKSRLQEERRGRPNPEVFLKVEIRDHKGVVAKGRMDFELYADVAPKTAENFRCLCTGEKGSRLSFAKTLFHRIIPGFMAQGGDITNGDGTGGISIYGAHFKDESFERRHERPGVLSMANCGRDTNNSQFFVLFKSAPHLDRKHVVFGHLIGEEHQILKRIEACGSESGTVKGEVEIVDCGEIKADTVPRARGLSRSRSRDRRGGGGGGRSLSANII